MEDSFKTFHLLKRKERFIIRYHLLSEGWLPTIQPSNHPTIQLSLSSEYGLFPLMLSYPPQKPVYQDKASVIKNAPCHMSKILFFLVLLNLTTEFRAFCLPLSLFPPCSSLSSPVSFSVNHTFQNKPFQEPG